jgi:hypothetical protein
LRERVRESVSMVTPEDDHKPDIDQLKSKMIRLPEEILMASLNPLSTNQLFRAGMENYEFEISKTCLEDRVKQFKNLFEQSLRHFSRTDDTDLKNQLERKLVGLVRNSCSTDFLVENGRDLATEKTFESALSFLADVFGSETEEERREEAKNQFEKLARRTDKNEKFSHFLKRIKSLAKRFVENSDALDYIVSEKFKSMIEPSNVTFLKNNCCYQKSADEVSKFLDDRERHMIVHVSAVGANQLNSFMDETGEMLNKQLSAIYDNNRKIQEANESKNAEMAKAIKELSAKISELTVAKKPSNFSPNPHNFGQPQGQNFGIPPFQPNFPAQNHRFQAPGAQNNFTGPNQRGQNFYGQNRFPIICNHCGKPGHSKRYCRFVTCNLCKAQGHVQKDCPKFPSLPSAPSSRDMSGN